MSEFISRHGYYHDPTFISKELAAYLASVLQAERSKGLMTMSDDQVPGAAYKHNSIPIKTMMMCLQEKMSERTGKRLEPTYCYTRIYYRGNDLKPHRDRPSCEYSVTVHLAGTHPWPIFIEDLDGLETGKCNSLTLQPGEAVIYRGCDVLHYREPYEGDWYIQAFLHYVDAEGPHRDMSEIEKRLPELPMTPTALPPFVQVYSQNEFAKENENKDLPQRIMDAFEREGIPNSKHEKWMIMADTEDRLRLAKELTDHAIQISKSYAAEFNIDLSRGAHDMLSIHDTYCYADEFLFGFTVQLLWLVKGQCTVAFPDYGCQVDLYQHQVLILPCSYAYMFTIANKHTNKHTTNESESESVTDSECLVIRSFIQ